MKAYESPMAEFIEFKDDGIFTKSATSCNCFGDQIYYETEELVGVEDPPNNCEAYTWDHTEIVPSTRPYPF